MISVYRLRCGVDSGVYYWDGYWVFIAAPQQVHLDTGPDDWIIELSRQKCHDGFSADTDRRFSIAP